MPILICGSEGEWALFENTLSAVGADDKRRGSVQLNAGETMFRAYAGSDDLWVHVRLAGIAGSSVVGTLQDIIQIRDGSSTVYAGLRCKSVADDGLFRTGFVYRDPDSGTLTLDPDEFTDDDETFAEYDFHLVRSTTSNSNDTLTIYFYRNAQLRRTRTLVLDAGSWNQPAELLISFASTDTDYDDVFVQDVIVTEAIPTVGMELVTLVPAAVGNYSDFDNDYTNIDDSGYDPSTVIATTTVTDKESWIFQTPSFNLGDKVIYAVVMNNVAQLDIGGSIGDFQPFLRISATDYNASAIGADAVAPDAYVSIFTTNPATAAAWVKSDLTGLEAGVQAIA